MRFLLAATITIISNILCSKAFQSTKLPFTIRKIQPCNDQSNYSRKVNILNLAKKNKGFKKKSKKVSEQQQLQPEEVALSTKKVDAVQQQRQQQQKKVEATSASNDMNVGQKALEQLRNKKQEEKEDEIRKMRDIKSIDDFISDDPNAAVIPEKVAMRMGNRMLPFVGIPLFGVMGTFIGFWYMATYKGVVYETVLVAYSTIFILVVSLLGITFSVMSASWDPDVEGSTMGIKEFTSNLDSIKSGLKRSRETLITREKMSGLSEMEVQNAISVLDKKEEKSVKLSSLDKLKKELE